MLNAIILAAGSSTRLRPLTVGVPKCLLYINGLTILDYQINALKKVGAERIYVVVGFKKELIKDHLSRSDSEITVVENNSYDVTDNSYSLFLGLQNVDAHADSVIVLDGDIVFDTELLIKLVNDHKKNVILADNRKKIVDEDCKVNISPDGFALEIGKKVSGQAVYTSMIKLGGHFLEMFLTELSKERSKPEWYSESLNRLLAQNHSLDLGVSVIFTENLDRCEIDTLDDFLEAKKVYKRIISRESKIGLEINE